MKICRMDHVGIVVDDLSAVQAFFLDLGFTTMEEGDVVGTWVKKITGLSDTGLTYTMLRTPDGGKNLELIKFHGPSDEADVQHNSAKSLGIRHICFSVEDIEAVVARVEKNGAELLGEIVNFDNVFKLCYLRGPEGIILELTEQLH